MIQRSTCVEDLGGERIADLPAGSKAPVTDIASASATGATDVSQTGSNDFERAAKTLEDSDGEEMQEAITRSSASVFGAHERRKLHAGRKLSHRVQGTA